MVKYTQIDDSVKIGAAGQKLLSGFARRHDRLEPDGVHTQLDSESMKLLKEAVTKLSLSARSAVGLLGI